MPADPISTYAYQNDLLGRRETISQGGSAFAGMNLGDHTIEVAYNNRSEVIGAETRRGDTPVARHTDAYDGIGNRTESRVSGPPSEEPETITTYETNALKQYASIRATGGASSTLPAAPSYDLDGNLLEDAENRLVRGKSKDGQTRVEYQYDYQGRRITKQTEVAPLFGANGEMKD